MKRRLHATVLIGLLLVALPASAVWWWVPTLVDGAIWLGSVAGNNYRVWKIAEVTSAGVAGALLTDMYLSSENDTSSAGKTPARVDVRLAPSAKRENPDPATWNDAAAGQVDPTPKAGVTVPTIVGGQVQYTPGGAVLSGTTLTITPSVTFQDTFKERVTAGYPAGQVDLYSHTRITEFPEALVTVGDAVVIDGVEVSPNALRAGKYQSKWINAARTVEYQWFLQDVTIKDEVFQTADHAFESLKSCGDTSCYGLNCSSQPDNICQGWAARRGDTTKHILINSTWDAYSQKWRCADGRLASGADWCSANSKWYTYFMDYQRHPINKDWIVEPFKIDLKNVVAVSLEEETATSRTYKLHSVTQRRLCLDGQAYDLASKTCIASSSITKPPTTPCQVVHYGGMWRTDDANPNCDQVTINHIVSGNIAQVQIGDERAEIEARADGSRRMTWHDGKIWRTVETGPCTSEGCAASAVTDSNTGSFTPINPGGSGQGGSCGGPTQPKCFIDDSGFDGKNQAIRDKIGEGESFLDAQKSGLEGKGSELAGQDHGWSSTWLPKLWPDPVQCEPLVLTMGFDHGPLAGLTASAPIEFCEQAASIKSFFAWLFYLGGVVYIWRVFTGSNAGGKK